MATSYEAYGAQWSSGGRDHFKLRFCFPLPLLVFFFFTCFLSSPSIPHLFLLWNFVLNPALYVLKKTPLDLNMIPGFNAMPVHYGTIQIALKFPL
jgi:hypothetical protein